LLRRFVPRRGFCRCGLTCSRWLIYKAVDMRIWINRAGQNIGTFTQEEVQQGLNDGRFVPTDLGWREGMETWKTLSEFPGLQIPPPLEQPAFPSPAGPLAQDSPPPMGAQLIDVARTFEDGPAWEHRKELGFFKALIETWKEILFRPGTSFPSMKTSGGFGTPLLFNVTMWVVGIIPSALYSLVSNAILRMAVAGSAGDSSFNSLQAEFGPMVTIVAMVFIIPIGIGFTFVHAGIVHLCLSLFKGTSKSYEATYRVVAYSSSAVAFALVPCVGSSVGGIWSIVSTIIGLSKVHKTEPWRASLAVLLPVFLCFVIVLALYAALIFSLVATRAHETA
jgi:hypothetical protein